MPVPYIIIEQKAPPKSGKGNKPISYPRCVYNRLVDTAEMATHISKTSTISTADLVGTLYALVEQMVLQLAQGNKVVLEGFGSFYVTAKTGALEDPDTLRSSDFRQRGIRYEPDQKLLQSLENFTFVKKE